MWPATCPSPGRGTSPEALDELEALIRASGGGALCLFSSRRAAEEAADALRPRLDVSILCQGESTMAALVQAVCRRAGHLPVRHHVTVAGRRRAGRFLPAGGD